MFGGLRSDLGGLPAMFTRDLKMRSEIEKNLNDILNRTSKRLDCKRRLCERMAKLLRVPPLSTPDEWAVKVLKALT